MKLTRLPWGLKVDQSFRDGVGWIGDQFEWSPLQCGYLMACMAWESAETFSPDVKNAAGSGAVGLIQFMPSTAEGLGTSTEELSAMTALRQLGYVYLYLKQYRKLRGPRVTLSDLYMSILMPKYIGAPESAPVFTTGIAYRQNAGLDINHDHVVTKAEAAQKVSQKLVRGNQSQYLFVA
jgi:hypothetical protein